ncbi:hypothetical protein AX15_000735 [Amanita polypyramis BW_CC]|nr:hypothetical protein AX15_000735 [Amanita polypyramis BW_CC]
MMLWRSAKLISNAFTSQTQNWTTPSGFALGSNVGSNREHGLVRCNSCNCSELSMPGGFSIGRTSHSTSIDNLSSVVNEQQPTRNILSNSNETELQYVLEPEPLREGGCMVLQGEW